MGTVKAWLRDDVETPDWGERPTAADPVPVAVDEDPAPTVVTEVNPRLTVRRRIRNGFDDDGVPLFGWADVVTAEALLFEERDEYDADAGLTQVKARAVLLYEGDVEVVESAVVVRDDGVRYRVLAVRQTPGRLEFDLARVAAT